MQDSGRLVCWQVWQVFLWISFFIPKKNSITFFCPSLTQPLTSTFCFSDLHQILDIRNWPLSFTVTVSKFCRIIRTPSFLNRKPLCDYLTLHLLLSWGLVIFTTINNPRTHKTYILSQIDSRSRIGGSHNNFMWNLLRSCKTFLKWPNTAM